MVNDETIWCTITGVLGDNMLGVWPHFADKTELVNSTCVDSKRTMVVTGDDFGFVKLFSFPCSQKGV